MSTGSRDYQAGTQRTFSAAAVTLSVVSAVSLPCIITGSGRSSSLAVGVSTIVAYVLRRHLAASTAARRSVLVDGPAELAVLYADEVAQRGTRKVDMRRS
jgi:hypothetical protein